MSDAGVVFPGREAVAVKEHRRDGHPCGICGNSVPLKRGRGGEARKHCSDRCRRIAWERVHPGLRGMAPEQRRLDFTPASSELAHALRGRETKAQRILARLRQGPATTWELAQTGGVRFGARLLELRRAGHCISTVEHADHAVYSLEEP